MRWLIAAFAGVLLSACVALGVAAADDSDATRRDVAPVPASAPIINEIAFVGLRRIASAAVRAQLSSRAGTLLDAQLIQSDVKTLGRLGWFTDIRVEELPSAESPSNSLGAPQHVLVIFRLEEGPDLVGVEYGGSRLLGKAQVEKILEEKQLAPRIGEPADASRLDRIAKTISSALAELGHPQASVQILRDEYPNATVRIHYEISDGPHLPVGRIQFEGHPVISTRSLQQQMHRTAPGALFASWRDKGVFTREGFAEDRSRLLIYYQEHGFPEARAGDASGSIYATKSSRWIPWAFRRPEKRLAVSVPIEAGPLYRFKSVDVGPDLVAASPKHASKLLTYGKAQAGAPYSSKTMEGLRHLWVAAIQPKRAKDASLTQRDVEATRTFDTDANEARVYIGFREAAPDIVGHIEFQGQHRFSDRYLRRRIGLEEGQAFDERGLEAGLARLTKTGYFHQIRKEDIRVERNGLTHTADVTVRISEAGQQHTSFSGGRGQFGSTLGLAYSLFDVLQREELLSARLDGGPESLQIALGLLLEGFLGSRSSLAISVFDNVLRPRFATSIKGPFYTSQSEGLNAGWGYALSPADAFSFNYALAHSNADYSLVLPPSLSGLPSTNLRAANTSSAAGFSLNHDAGANQFSIANSVSGGRLGGSENIVRSNEQYARIFPDPIFARQNAWAFRTTFTGAGSYHGDLPLYARLFSGDAQVRGVNPGDLGPYAVIPSTAANGSPGYSALPAGANIIFAANFEYRVPLAGHAEAAGFFDIGSGWLLPNWLGKARPTLLESTNGVLHGSFGIEVRWTVPEIQVPVRAYYSVNVLRLNRFLRLSDGSLFHAHNRLFAFGWAVGRLF